MWMAALAQGWSAEKGARVQNCSHMVAERRCDDALEASTKAFLDKLKGLTETSRILGTRVGKTEKNMQSLSGEGTFTGVHTDEDLEWLGIVTRARGFQTDGADHEQG